MDHYAFISRTDNKSLYNQIKYLVTCAQESYANDLATRKKHLRDLLDSEEKGLENEFIDKIKSRVDLNIRERQDSLQTMKQQRTKETEKFLASKKLHQNMLNCIDIREELRRKDYRDTQLCQLEQMDEKLRAIARSKKDDEFWQKVQARITEDIDRKQQHEIEVKRALQANQCTILDQQLAEHCKLRDMDSRHVHEEKIALNQKLKSYNDCETVEKSYAAELAKNLDTRISLNRICEQRKLLQQEAQTFEDTFHEESMRQVKKEMDEAMRTDKKLRESVFDYLNYVRIFKTFAADQERKRDELCDELGRYFYCYKNQNKVGMAEKKRQTAESTHKIVLKQICEEQARRAMLAAAEKENKMIENRFARRQVFDKLKQREKIKQGLDQQLEEIARLRTKKQKEFEGELNRAQEDANFCEQLLQRHKSDGCDYLPPHPNWKLQACFKGDGGNAKKLKKPCT